MDERESRIEIPNPNDRLSTPDIELNHLNSVQFVDKQNARNDSSYEKTCVTNSSHSRTDIDIKDVASHIKEKLHLNSNSGLLNGYNCHSDCRLNLNGVEECEDEFVDEGLTDKFAPRQGETNEPLVFCHSDNVCETNENYCRGHCEPQNPVILRENISECQSDESTLCRVETLSDSDSPKPENENLQSLHNSSGLCGNSQGAVGESTDLIDMRCKCICKKAPNSNCENVKGEQLPNKNCLCYGRSEEKGIDEYSTIISSEGPIKYVGYESENQMPDIMQLIQKDLSEPYSIYTYRYFIHNWPKLCFLAMDGEKCVGAIVCKLDMHKKHSKRGYIAMLAVDENYRKRKIGSNLVLKAIQAMIRDEADEVVLETEITNKPALRLYENLGFVRDKRLFRYYLNGVDALRLKLWLR